MTAMQNAGARIDARIPQGTVPGGEARNIHVGGGRYVSLLGNGPYFHNPMDLWPQSVDLDAVVSYASRDDGESRLRWRGRERYPRAPV